MCCEQQQSTASAATTATADTTGFQVLAKEPRRRRVLATQMFTEEQDEDFPVVARADMKELSLSQVLREVDGDYRPCHTGTHDHDEAGQGPPGLSGRGQGGFVLDFGAPGSSLDSNGAIHNGGCAGLRLTPVVASAG